jgi:hypothetical protein
MNEYKRLALLSVGLYALATLVLFTSFWLKIEFVRSQNGGEKQYLDDLALVVPFMTAAAGVPVLITSIATLCFQNQKGLSIGLGFSAFLHTPAMYLTGYTLIFGILEGPPNGGDLIAIIGTGTAAALHVGLMWTVWRFLRRTRRSALARP